jgi:hypothetical protein
LIIISEVCVRPNDQILKSRLALALIAVDMIFGKDDVSDGILETNKGYPQDKKTGQYTADNFDLARALAQSTKSDEACWNGCFFTMKFGGLV